MKHRLLSLLLLIPLGFSLSSCDKIQGFFDDLFHRGESSSSSSTMESPPSSTSSSPSLSSPSDIDSSSASGEIIANGSLEFHFLELGNAYTGDSIYVKANGKDILIDAGSRKNSAEAIAEYLDPLLGDDHLDYVIPTHAHQDHIAGFVGNSDKSAPGGRDGIFYRYDIDHIYDFAYYDDGGSSVYSNAEALPSEAKTTAIYKDYRTAREYAVSQGAEWQTVGELFEDGKKVYTVDLGDGVYMDILYTFFYDHTSADIKELSPEFSKSSFSNQNDCSVCVLFRQGEKAYLFTGDAEEAAEFSLASEHDLPTVELFKAGHHGSYTASGELLLSKIQPKRVCVCCCAGNTEYTDNPQNTFPSQAAIDRIAEYTSEVYVTTVGSMTDKSYFAPLNGTIVVSSPSSEDPIAVNCSHSNLPLKDQEWFKVNRTCPESWAI